VIHAHSPGSLPAPGILPGGGSAEDPAARLESLEWQNRALGRDLLRCYEQLSLVHDVTASLADLNDPDRILEALLERYSAMLNASHLFAESGDHCGRVALSVGGEPGVAPEAEGLREALIEEIDATRRARRSRVADLPETVRRRIGTPHVLLATLERYEGEPLLLIALRAPTNNAFDSADMLAAETVLGYTGRLLSNLAMVQRLEHMALDTVRAFANAVDAKDRYTRGHSERVSWLARLTGRELGLSETQLQQLEWAGMLHDVGKIGVPEQILNKPGKLDDDEFEQIKTHSRLSYEVIKPVACLQPILGAVLHHHEDYDGGGYPDGLSDLAIPLGARIVRVVDIFDALTSTRTYRAGLDLSRALAVLEQGAGRATDPRVTFAFVRAFRAYLRNDATDFRTRFPHLASQPAASSATQPTGGSESSP
jgi:HD-GYP domain-containing protein (c-di-GMP phosphodiesterase class II)